MEFVFTIPGDPVGKGRPRFDSRNGRVYTPTKTKEYEEYVRWCFAKEYKDADPIKGPVSIRVDAYFKAPKSAKKEEKEKMLNDEIRPVKKPDCDNILKAVADALNGAAYPDDRQIAEAVISKHYAEEGRVDVKIAEI